MEQQAKLKGVLSSVLNEWTQPNSQLLSIASAEQGRTYLVEYFGLNQDAQSVQANIEFLSDRTATRLRLRWITSATVSIVRRLNAPVSPEQVC